MFLASDVISAIKKNGLDSDNTSHYSNDRNYFPAINSAIRWIISVAQASMGEGKLKEEAFGELSEARVYQTSKYSRVNLVGAWGVLAVYPLPTTIKISDGTAGAVISNAESNYTSLRRSDLTHISGKYSAKRMTVEEWADNEGNPFSPSNTVVTGELIDYGYLSPYDYSHSKTEQGVTTYYRNTIEIRPYIVEKLCTVFQINEPEIVSAETTKIFFSYNLFNLLVQKATKYIAYQQGSNDDIYSVTTQDINELIASM